MGAFNTPAVRRLRSRSLAEGAGYRAQLTYYPPATEQHDHHHARAHLSFLLSGCFCEVSEGRAYRLGIATFNGLHSPESWSAWRRAGPACRLPRSRPSVGMTGFPEICPHQPLRFSSRLWAWQFWHCSGRRPRPMNETTDCCDYSRDDCPSSEHLAQLAG